MRLKNSQYICRTNKNNNTMTIKEQLITITNENGQSIQISNHTICNMIVKQIKVSNIRYLALVDENYADDYANDNEMTELEKEEWLNELRNRTELTISVEDFVIEDEHYLHEYLELEETQEYIEDFDWKIC